MKKLIFVFIALFTLTLISGCGARQNTIRYDSESESSETTDVTEDTSEDSESTETESEEETMETDSDTESEEEVETDSEEDIVEESETPKVTDVPVEGKLAVTSLDGAFLKTNLSYNVVKGTVPTGTHTISINDYQLQKYIPGQTQWDYIASTQFSTLKIGLNNYILKTFDANGDQTDSLIFSIDYDAPAVPTLPDVGSSHWLVLLISLMLAGSFTTFRKLRWL